MARESRSIDTHGAWEVTANRTTLFVSIATAFSLLGDQVLYSVLPVYHEQLGITAIEVGILLSANRWIRLFTNDLARRAASRVRPDVAMVGALSLGALTTMAYTFTDLFSVLLAARLAWGLSWSFIRHVGVLGVMAGAADDRVGRTMGVYNGLSRLGSVSGLLGGAVLVDLLGFHQALIALGVVSLLAVPLGWIGLRGFTITTADPRDRSGGGSILRYGVIGFTIGMVGPGFVMATLGTVLNARIDTAGLFTAATLTGLLLAVRFMLDTAAAPWLGSLTDRYGLRTTASGFLALGGVALTLAALPLGVGWVGFFVIAFFISGTALHAGVAGTVATLGDGAFSRYVTASDFGAAVGPIAGWVAVDALGVDTIGLVMGAGAYLGAAVFAAVALGKRQVTG